MKTILGLILISFATVGCVTKHNVVTPTGQTNVVYNVSPGLSNTLATIKAANDTIALVNPYATPINLLLATIGGVASWYAAKKTSAANKSDALLRTVVAGVENAAATNTPTKAAIADLAGKRGLYPELDSIVQKTTGA